MGTAGNTGETKTRWPGHGVKRQSLRGGKAAPPPGGDTTTL